MTTVRAHFYTPLFFAIESLALILLFGCTTNAAPGGEDVVPTPSALVPIPSPTVVPSFTSEPGDMQSTPHVSPYVKVRVSDVEVRFLPTSPVQVELVIRGTLPDQCKYEFYAVESRVEENVRVNLDGIHPAQACDSTPQTIEYVMPLGQNRPEAERGFPPGDYQLTVNNFQTSFSIQP